MIGEENKLQVLKNLESKKLIKTVKAVGTTKKCYMLYNLEPDTSLTGGMVAQFF